LQTAAIDCRSLQSAAGLSRDDARYLDTSFSQVYNRDLLRTNRDFYETIAAQMERAYGPLAKP